MHVGKRLVQILSELVNDLCSPALRPLPGQNLLSDPPIEQDQLLIHCRGGADLRCPNTSLEDGQKVLVVLRTGNNINHGHISLTDIPHQSQWLLV